MFLPKPPNDLAHCFICSAPARTQEHVIPKWLQHRFNLWNELLTLPNGSSIRYRQLTIPACLRCNNEIFGALESRVENDTCTDSDVWKWANKIHFGLGHKHHFLEWDRKNPGYKMGAVVSQSDVLERDRHFLHSVAGHFRTEPDPFGSVFRFEFSQPASFRFAHLMHSRSLCVCLGRVGYVVFVLDGQAMKRDISTSSDYTAMPQKKIRVEDMLFFYAKCVEHLARHELGQNIVMTEGFLARFGKTVVHRVHPVDKARFRRICEILGIHWIDSDPGSG